jgi:photosystem II stability/assembly factor-like uncharacterized protein
MKKKLSLLFLLTFTFFSQAQVFWEVVPTNFSTANRVIQQISFAPGSPNVAWVNVYDGTTPTNNIQEFGLTIDGGLTWTSGSINVGNAVLGIGSIQAIDATTAVVAMFVPTNGAGGGIWKTTNSGATWVQQTSAVYNDVDSFPNVVGFANANDGFTSGDPIGGFFEIYNTSNGGTLWNRVASSPVLAALPGEFGTTRNLYTIGNDFWFGTNKGRLFHSADKGVTWTVGGTPLADTNTGKYAFKDTNNGILTDDGYNLWKTIDGGATWIDTVPNGSVRDGALTYVPGTDNTYVNLGVGDGVPRGSSYSCDGGDNWENINLLGDDFSVNVSTWVAFSSPSVGIASGNNFTTAIGSFRFVAEPFGSATSLCPSSLSVSSQSYNNLFSISPNPTSDVLSLKGLNINQVAVTDILGKVVINNTYLSLSDVTLNLSDLNSGVYFVKITNNEGTSSTSKVVKQ